MSMRVKIIFGILAALSSIILIVFGFMFLNNKQHETSIIDVPTGYTGSPTSLVVALHGSGQTPEDFKNMSKLSILGEQENFITVYPHGLGDPSGWNAGDCCGEAVKSNQNDVEYIAEVIEDVQTKYNIDNKRIYVLGFSNGGMMAYRLGCQLSDIVAAIGSVSGNGSVGKYACDGLPVSYIQIHGGQDKVVPLEGGKGSGGDEVFTSYDLAIDAYVNKNKCAESESTVLPNVEIEVWDYCMFDTEVKFFNVLNGSHEWLNVNGADAGRIVWNFFKSHPKS